MPSAALAACLELAGATAADVDQVVFYEKPVSAFARSLKSLVHVAPAGVRQFQHAMPSYLRSKLWVERAVERAFAEQ